MSKNKKVELEAYQAKAKSIRDLPVYKDPIMFGLCREIVDSSNYVLESKYLYVNYKENYDLAAILIMIGESLVSEDSEYREYDSENEFSYVVTKEFIDRAFNEFAGIQEDLTQGEQNNLDALIAIYNAMKAFEDLDDVDKSVIGEQRYRFVGIYNDAPIETPSSAYLKLSVVSEGLVGIRTLNLNNMMPTLKNCAWTYTGEPIGLDDLRNHRMRLIATGEYPNITHIDKLPRYLSHFIPANNTRILDTSKVRLGAQLGDGTVVMPGASYINFNSGTNGKAMVEGRISSEAIVGEDSDIGGGASILGVLSGTDGNPITIGSKCLLGANSVCGISLGDGCIIDAGLAVLDKTPVFVSSEVYDTLKDINGERMPTVDMSADGMMFYAFELSGLDKVHFRRDAVNGKVVALVSDRVIELNKDLH